MKILPYRPSAALLSRKAVKNNLQLVRECVRTRTVLHHSKAEIMAMVKADAYGHDLDLILPELEKQGVKHFAVASLEEGLEARSLSRKAEILVLGGSLRWNSSLIELLQKNRLKVAANDIQSLKTLLSVKGLKVHLKLDTGMNRLGVKPADWPEALQILRRSQNSLDGLFTHYATSGDELFHSQARLFEEAVRWLVSEGICPQFIHSENSAALLNKNQLKRGILSERANLVRPGISLYGYFPRKVKGSLPLSPVLELVSEVGLVKSIEAGEGISYGHLYKAKSKHSYGIVSLGYADGLSKAYAQSLRPMLRNSRGKRKAWLKICGAICMDMVMVKAEGAQKLDPKDLVVFWGRFKNEVLKAGLVEPYELNLRIAKRIPRIWVP